MLKWNFFWKYIENFNEIISRQSTSFVQNEKLFDFYMTWWKNDDYCRTALRSCVKKNFYDDIAECVTVKLIWNKIKQVCELKDFSAFLITYVKYEIFKCANCESLFQYGVKFRKIGNELIIYFEKIRLELNWLIFKYLVDLSKSVAFFIDRWVFEHDFINNEIEVEYDVVTLMHVYEVQCVNFVDFSAHNDIDVVFFVTGLVVDIIKNIVDDSMKVKMMTHCDYFSCDKNDHWFKDCRLKHFEKQKTFDERNKTQKKRRDNKTKNRKNKKNKNKNKNKKINKNKSKKIKTKKFYETMKIYVNHFAFVAVVIHLHVLTINVNVSISNFIKFWLLDTNAFFHIIDDRNVFVFFIFMFNRIVDDIDENFKTKKYDFIRLFCKKNRLFIINNVFYVKKCFYNFLSFN